MSDGPFIISPMGFIADVSYAGLPNFGGSPGKSPWSVTQLLPGGLVSVVGSGGQLNLTGQLSGARGTMQVDLTTGTAGGSQGVAVLASGGTGVFIGVFLSSTNGPGIVITDVNGTSVVNSSSGTNGSGVPLQVIVQWNSVSGSYQLLVNGVVTVSGTHAAWTSFSPSSLVYGAPVASVSTFAAFVGHVNKVQVSNVGSP